MKPATVAFISWLLPVLTVAAPPDQKSFASPAAVVSAFVAAVESRSDSLLAAVMGPGAIMALRAANEDRDGRETVSLLDSIRPVRLRSVPGSPNQMVLLTGTGDRLSLPMVLTPSGWRFDGDAGAKEIIKRRIRRNEMAAIESSYRYLDAQLDYARSHAEGGAASFASRIRSSPGRQDGLFWSEGEPGFESPLGPGFARAAFAEQPADAAPKPHFGYYFKVLLAQGPDAPGGALNYRVDGGLRKGFALIAWPAEYGMSGLHSFLVSQAGDVYRKDLGAGTARSAASMTVFNPDCSWTLTGSEFDDE